MKRLVLLSALILVIAVSFVYAQTGHEAMEHGTKAVAEGGAHGHGGGDSDKGQPMMCEMCQKMMGQMGQGQMGMMCEMCQKMMGQMGQGQMGMMGMMGQGQMGKGQKILGMMGQGMMGQMGQMGQGMPDLDCPKVKKFLDETVKERRELVIKIFEYFEASRNPDTSAETLSKLQEEMRKLQVKVFEKTPWGY